MPRSLLQLQDGTQVELFDSEGSSAQESAWVDFIKKSRQPSILKTLEGHYRCWIDGQPAGATTESPEQALEEISHLLGKRNPLGHLKPCPGVGSYVSDAAIGTVGVHRVTMCHACEEYVAVDGNRIAFHPYF